METGLDNDRVLSGFAEGRLDRRFGEPDRVEHTKAQDRGNKYKKHYQRDVSHG